MISAERGEDKNQLMAVLNQILTVLALHLESFSMSSFENILKFLPTFFQLASVQKLTSTEFTQLVACAL